MVVITAPAVCAPQCAYLRRVNQVATSLRRGCEVHRAHIQTTSMLSATETVLFRGLLTCN